MSWHCYIVIKYQDAVDTDMMNAINAQIPLMGCTSSPNPRDITHLAISSINNKYILLEVTCESEVTQDYFSTNMAAAIAYTKEQIDTGIETYTTYTESECRDYIISNQEIWGIS